MNDIEQRARQFREDGFCVVPDVFSGEEIDELRAKTQRVIDGARGVGEANHIYDFERFHTADDPKVRRIKKPHEVDPLYRSRAEQPNLLQLLVELIGPHVRLHHSKINLKSGKYGSPLEWHQDWAFIPHTNMDLAICAVMLDDCTEDNGPVLMIPGSHKGPLHDHHHDGAFYGAIDVEKSGLQTERAVPILGTRGSVSFHHPMTVHGSALNKSQSERNLLFYEYAAADAWPLFYGVDFEEFDSRLVLGGSCNEPRLEPVYVRMPYPVGPQGQGLIYAQQEAFKNKFFETYQA